MTEINNNIPNYGRNIEGCERVEKHPQNLGNKEVKAEETAAKQYVPDTGVLGRSQVKTKIGADISKSVDDAVTLATNNPALMNSCEFVFDLFYDNYIKEGMNPSDAFAKALLAEEEFLEIGAAQTK